MASAATRLRPGAPPVLLSPHLDDAVWSCYTILAGDEPVTVVNVCAGVPPPGEPPPWDRACGASERAAHVRRRLAEDADALGTVGRSAIALPLLDQQYRGGEAEPLERALAALAEAVPEAGGVLAAAGIGRHPDHVLVRDMGLALARAGLPARLYADYAYCVRHGWPAFVAGDGREAAAAHWHADLAGCPVAVERPRVRRLSEAEAAAKLSVMRRYVTQFAPIEREEPRWQDDGLPPSDGGLLRFEALWDVA